MRINHVQEIHLAGTIRAARQFKRLPGARQQSFAQQFQLPVGFANHVCLLREIHRQRDLLCRELRLRGAFAVLRGGDAGGDLVAPDRQRHAGLRPVKRRRVHLGLQPGGKVGHLLLAREVEVGLGHSDFGCHFFQARIPCERRCEQLFIAHGRAGAFKFLRHGRIGLAGGQAERGLEFCQQHAARIFEAGNLRPQFFAFDLRAQHVLQRGFADFILRAGEGFQIGEQREHALVDADLFVQKMQRIIGLFNPGRGLEHA